MAKVDVLLSSENERWSTPPGLFEKLDREFGGFTLDAAAEKATAKCPVWFGLKHRRKAHRDGLAVDWTEFADGGPVWLNPPYGRKVSLWVRKAYLESRKGLTIVVLIFARVETLWWDEYVSCADEVRWIKGRVVFHDPDTGMPRCNSKGQVQGATAPSAVVIFRPHWNGPPRYRSMRQPKRRTG